MPTNKRIAVGADHAGYRLKSFLVEHLKKNGYDVDDVGTASEDSVDYPDFALMVGQKIADRQVDRGLLVCGSGLGIAIAANKVSGVRAAPASTVELAQLGREHNDTNVLTIGARIVDESLATDILDAWLNTAFEGGRHQRRVDKITDIERGKRE